MPSTIDPSIPPLRPSRPVPSPSAPRQESPYIQQLISHLSLQAHIEGGYFVETDRDPVKVDNPFRKNIASSDEKDKYRNQSTTIHYLLTPASPLGAFHRNSARTIHTLQQGRGRYVIIHADEVMRDDGYVNHPHGARVETFVVGHDFARGERMQWIVDGGKYKASFLLPMDGDENSDGEQKGLLISETVIPGFEFEDHDFLRKDRFEALIPEDKARELEWLVRRDG